MVTAKIGTHSFNPCWAQLAAKMIQKSLPWEHFFRVSSLSFNIDWMIIARTLSLSNATLVLWIWSGRAELVRWSRECSIHCWVVLSDDHENKLKKIMACLREWTQASPSTQRKRKKRIKRKHSQTISMQVQSHRIWIWIWIWMWMWISMSMLERPIPYDNLNKREKKHRLLSHRRRSVSDRWNSTLQPPTEANCVCLMHHTSFGPR